jgi:putative membrane protein
MANERTLLSYLRTAMGFVAIGVPAVWWFEERVIQALGVLSLIAGMAFIGIGMRRFLMLKAEINRQSD